MRRTSSKDSRVRVVAACCVGLGLLVLPAASEALPSPAQSLGSPAGPKQYEQSPDPAVQDLMDEFKLDRVQAERQMATQAAATEADTSLSDELLSVFSGRRIFHGQGARVEVSTTDAMLAPAFREHYLRAGVPVDVVVAPRTRAQVEGLIDQINHELQSERPKDDPGRVSASESIPGLVTITVADGVLLPGEQRVVDGAGDAPKEYRIERVKVLEQAALTSCDYSPDISCDPPIRGSMRIAKDDAARTPSCTAGFNVRSRTDSKPYVLAAGHCRDTVDAYARFANNVPHRIGPWHSAIWNSDTDVGIISVANPSGWSFGWPMITIAPNQGQDDDYVLNSVGDPVVGDRVCFTAGNGDLTLVGGTFDGGRTDCGTVDIRYDSAVYTDGLFRTKDVCLVGGDSGSPAFSYGVAYGVQSASNMYVGCTKAWSEQALEAQDQMNVNILTS